MFKNYIRTAIRNIIRDGYYSVIKIAGLALGIGTSLVIFLYVSYQFSFDKDHPQGERTFRVNQTNIWDPAGGKFSSTGPAVALDLLDNYPEVEAAVRISSGPQVIRYVKTNGEVLAFNEDKVIAADSNFFSFFGFQLQEGDPETSLNGNNKVVLSHEAALRLFGEGPAVGKLIQLGDERVAVEVTGVTMPQPSNTHFQFDYLFSLETFPAIKRFQWSWIYTQVVTYIRLKPGVDRASFASKILNAPDVHAQSTFQRLNMDYAEFKAERGAWELHIQPVPEIHLHSINIGNILGKSGNVRNVLILGVIGIFILLIAIINFINLSTARATNRAKEVGVKKTLGWTNSSLILQFQTEHMLITLISMMFGLGFMEILRIVLEPVTGLVIPVSTLQTTEVLVMLALLPIVVGFLAGLYPSFYLTSFQPAQVLNGKKFRGMSSSHLRNGLVVFQFTISIALMAATVIIFTQLKYFQSKAVGFEKENLLVINHSEKLGPQLESFRNELQNFEGVTIASVSMDFRLRFEDIFMREGDPMKLPVNAIKIDEHFIEVTRLSVVAGRTFEKRVGDKDKVIINETTASLFGWTPEEALGSKILYIDRAMGPQEVIGVVKDFQFQSLRQNIAPVIFFNIDSDIWGDNRIVLIRYDHEAPAQLINKIQNTWNKLAEATPFEYSFYDEEVKKQYDDEAMLGSLFGVFTGLSITIAIIGLVGLAAYSAEQRKKEISIRKVFGASLGRIYLMLNSYYIKLMILAMVIATPITWWLMQQWLEAYSNRIEINPLVFVLAGLVELVIALTCVGYLALRASSMNPAEVLKES